MAAPLDFNIADRSYVSLLPAVTPSLCGARPQTIPGEAQALGKPVYGATDQLRNVTGHEMEFAKARVIALIWINYCSAWLRD